MEGRFLATRRSLIRRLADLGDQSAWREFFGTYWSLIYSVARQTGLDEFESEEAVQETVISVARKIAEFRYDPSLGTFRGWLLTLARWKISDQFRKRLKAEDPATETQIAALEQPRFADIWDAEWEKHLVKTSLEKLKQKSSLEQFQIFECYVIKGWPARKVAKELQVSVGSVYLAKNRLLPIFQEITARVEKGGNERSST